MDILTNAPQFHPSGCPSFGAHGLQEGASSEQPAFVGSARVVEQEGHVKGARASVRVGKGK